MKKVLRCAIIGGLFLVPLVPALVFNNLFFPFITSKNFFFRIIVEVVGVLWAILALIDPRARPKKTWILWAILLFLAVIGLADLLGANPYKSFWSNFERMEGYITILHLGLYFLVASSVLRAERLWNYLLNTSLGVSIFIAFYSLLQISHELVINQGGVRVDGTFGNAIYLAIYMLFNIFIAILLMLNKETDRKSEVVPYVVGFLCFIYYYVSYYIVGPATAHGPGITLFIISIIGFFAVAVYFFVYGESPRGRMNNISYAVIAILLGVVMYYTATRGAIVALFGALILLALLLLVFGRKIRTYKIAGASILAVLVIATGLFFGLRQSTRALQSPILGRVLSISFGNADTQTRLRIWKMGWQGFKERPLLGWGQDGFNFVFNTYYDPRLYNREQWFDRVHNIFFDWLVAGGLLGILSYLALYVAAFYELWKKRSLTILEKSVITSLFAGYFIFNLTVFDNIGSYILFFTFLAYIAWTPEEKEEGEGLPLRVASLYAGLLIILFIVVLWYANIKPIRANETLISAIVPQNEGPLKNYEYFQNVFSLHTFADGEAREQLLQYALSVSSATSPDDATKLKFVTFAADELKKQVEASPNDARYNLFLGSFLSHFGQNDAALQYLSQAKRLSPKKQLTLFELGSLKLRTGDIKGALSEFKDAYEYEPSYVEARVVYAAGAIFAHDTALVDSLLNFEDGRLYGDDRITSAYKASGQLAKFPAQIKKQIARNPNNIDLLTKLAQIDLALENRTDAILALQRIAALRPDLEASVNDLIKQIREGKKF